MHVITPPSQLGSSLRSLVTRARVHIQARDWYARAPGDVDEARINSNHIQIKRRTSAGRSTGGLAPNLLSSRAARGLGDPRARHVIRISTSRKAECLANKNWSRTSLSPSPAPANRVRSSAHFETSASVFSGTTSYGVVSRSASAAAARCFSLEGERELAAAKGNDKRGPRSRGEALATSSSKRQLARHLADPLRGWKAKRNPPSMD